MSGNFPRDGFDGNRSKYSKAVVIAVSKPPTWRSPFNNVEGTDKQDVRADVKNLSFENLFVYNFFTMDERTRYSFHNPSYKTAPNSLVDTAIRDITGAQVRGQAHWESVSSNMIPSYIRLSWSPPPGFEGDSRIADESRINAFKYLAGLSEKSNSSYNITPITTENFELHQRDYVRATNEFLDMFSFDPDGQPVNNWFAEELDATGFQQRMEFLYRDIIDADKKYKNFSGPGHSLGIAENGNGEMVRTEYNIDSQDLSAVDDNFNNTNMAEEIDIAQTQVYDSALLENLNFPTWNRTLPEDTTIVMNTDHAWSVSAASKNSSGLLLGMQSRVRSISHWQEVLVKAGVSIGSSVGFSDIVESGTRTVGPLEHIVKNSYPYDIEDLNRSPGTPELDFRIVGFVIEKTQRVETEGGAEEDKVKWAYEKFPLIFVPCNVGSMTTSYIDAAINYDKEYDYTIRAVFSFSLDVPVEEENEVVTKRFHYFMNSPYSTVLTIETREIEPPPYPRDVWAFHEYYTDVDGALALHWAFPVNRQRDVTYFAIFRRKSIYEPFQLLQVYDFNYSISDPQESAREIKAIVFGHDTGRFTSAEVPDTASKIKRLRPGEPNTMYKDRKFRSDTDYIYTVCAIDAHGQMSNYSAQLKIRLDSRLYKLHVQQISPPGAPLALPNFFIKGKAFEDVARTARYKRATLRFRPDYKSVEVDGANKKIVHGMSEDDGGNSSNCYFLQIINPDRANDIVLRYQINDHFEIVQDEKDLIEVAHMMGLPSGNLKS